VAAVGLETDGDRLPHSRIGVATVDRLAEPDPVTAQAMIDAVIISAEVASMGRESPSPALQPEPPSVRPAPAAPVQPEPPAARRTSPTPFDFVSELPVELPGVQPPAPAVGIPATRPVHSEVEPVPPAADDDMVIMPPEETDAGVYELPAAELGPPLPPQAAPPDREEVPPGPAAQQDHPSPLWPASEPADLPAAAMPVPGPDGVGRIRFKGASLDVSGMVATATVKLVHGDREVTGRAVGRNAQERRLFLAAEAAARAVTEFLPQGYGVVVHDIQPAPAEVGKALWAVVLFLTPNGEESLLGIAPIEDMVFEAAGKAVLNAVNRRVGLLLGSTS